MNCTAKKRIYLQSFKFSLFLCELPSSTSSSFSKPHNGNVEHTWDPRAFIQHNTVVYVVLLYLIPISGMLGHSTSHWVDIHNLLSHLPFDAIFGSFLLFPFRWGWCEWSCPDPRWDLGFILRKYLRIEQLAHMLRTMLTLKQTASNYFPKYLYCHQQDVSLLKEAHHVLPTLASLWIVTSGSICKKCFLLRLFRSVIQKISWPMATQSHVIYYWLIWNYKCICCKW